MCEILNIGRIERNTSVEGFGNRYCLWFQGCSIRCKGCANFEMWETDGGRLYSVADILKDIECQGSKIEGITILGGEPFEQPRGLYELTKKCQERGYSVILFTGFLYEELMKQEGKKDILKYTDLLIDGPYIEEKKELSRPWVGSSNQRYWFLSEKYSEDDLEGIKNKLEIRISKGGSIMINGMCTCDVFR